MNKKYNVALLFELLVNRITESTVNKNADRASEYSKLMKKYFHAGTNINNELKLYSNLCLESHDCTSDIYISELINGVLAEAAGSKYSSKEEVDQFFVDLSKLEESKVFLDQKIPNDRYKLTMSAWQLIMEKRGIKVFDNVKARAMALATLYEHNKNNKSMLEEDAALKNIKSFKDTEITNYIYKHMFKVFNEDNFDKLNESQRTLVDQFIRSKNDKELKEWMCSEYDSLEKSYVTLLKEVTIISKERVEKSYEDLKNRKDKLNKISMSHFSNSILDEVTILALHEQVIDELTECNNLIKKG